MIKDQNLSFLKVADNNDLKTLVDYMLPKKSNNFLDFLGNVVTEISGELSGHPLFLKYYPHHLNQMTDVIIDELQKYGGSTISNHLFRFNKGVQYSEILKDVFKQLKIRYDENMGIEENEFFLLQTIFIKSLNNSNLSKKDIEEYAEKLGVKSSGSKQAAIAAIQLAIKSGKFASFQIALIVANAVSKAILGRGLSLVANAGLVRYMAIFAGPIGWFLTGLWTIIDLAGPAYRVTIPAVIQIAYMRQKFNEDAYNYSR